MVLDICKVCTENRITDPLKILEKFNLLHYTFLPLDGASDYCTFHNVFSTLEIDNVAFTTYNMFVYNI